MISIPRRSVEQSQRETEINIGDRDRYYKYIIDVNLLKTNQLHLKLSGTVIVREGDVNGRSLFVVECGTVSVRRFSQTPSPSSSSSSPAPSSSSSLSLSSSLLQSSGDTESTSEREIMRLGKGSVFGEISLLKGSPRAATVVAHEDCSGE